MQRIAIWLASTVAAVALLFSYRTSTAGAPAIASGSSSRRIPSGPSVALRRARDQVVRGPAIDTRWGPVQVSAHVSAGRLTEITVLQMPADNQRDIDINNAALPILHDEAIAAQSAQIDTVSGASYTSDGYRQSLQGALDRLVAAVAPPAATVAALPPTGTTGSASTAAARVVDGPTIDTRWGPVQVSVVLRGRRIRDVKVLQVPSDNPRDAEINGFAVPVLHDEAIAAQSAQIDTVSGASYTSDGYRQSLQGALDQAGL